MSNHRNPKILHLVSIVDAFIFFDELELLEFRLAELDNVVDTFVLVESDLTHSGKQKPLYFAENQSRFSSYADRIVHVVHQRFNSEEVNAWDRERAQRNAMLVGLERAGATGNDLVIISDCDEIPRADLLAQIKLHGFNILVDRGKVGCLEGAVNHLWHGSMTDRSYTERVLRWAEYRFDPSSDLALAEHGCWRWASRDSDKPALHQYVKTYFACRREDG